MAVTIFGFGTDYFGETDLHPDGSFVTTEWITAIGVPIIPVRSFRFVRIQSKDVRTWGFRDEVFGLLGTLPICWPQVIRVYSFLAGTSIWLAAMIWLLFGKYLLFDRLGHLPLVLIITITSIAPYFVVSWSRRRAFHRRYGAGPMPRIETRLSEVPFLEIRRSTEILSDW